MKSPVGEGIANVNSIDSRYGILTNREQTNDYIYNEEFDPGSG